MPVVIGDKWRKAQRDVEHWLPIRSACGDCGAAPGASCVTQDGVASQSFHASRRRAAHETMQTILLALGRQPCACCGAPLGMGGHVCAC